MSTGGIGRGFDSSTASFFASFLGSSFLASFFSGGGGAASFFGSSLTGSSFFGQPIVNIEAMSAAASSTLDLGFSTSSAPFA